MSAISGSGKPFVMHSMLSTASFAYTGKKSPSAKVAIVISQPAAFEKDIFAAEAAQLNGKAISEFKRKFIIV